MTNTNTDARHSISWHVYVAFAISSLLLNIYSRFRFSHIHWLQHIRTAVLFVDARYKLVPPMTLSRPYLTRPAHSMGANPHCRPVQFRPLDITPPCHCVYLFCTGNPIWDLEIPIAYMWIPVWGICPNSEISAEQRVRINIHREVKFNVQEHPCQTPLRTQRRH